MIIINVNEPRDSKIHAMGTIAASYRICIKYDACQRARPTMTFLRVIL